MSPSNISWHDVRLPHDEETTAKFSIINNSLLRYNWSETEKSESSKYFSSNFQRLEIRKSFDQNSNNNFKKEVGYRVIKCNEKLKIRKLLYARKLNVKLNFVQIKVLSRLNFKHIKINTFRQTHSKRIH